jgi:hypothetical protein
MPAPLRKCEVQTLHMCTKRHPHCRKQHCSTSGQVVQWCINHSAIPKDRKGSDGPQGGRKHPKPKTWQTAGHGSRFIVTAGEGSHYQVTKRTLPATNTTITDSRGKSLPGPGARTLYNNHSLSTFSVLHYGIVGDPRGPQLAHSSWPCSSKSPELSATPC